MPKFIVYQNQKNIDLSAPLPEIKIAHSSNPSISVLTSQDLVSLCLLSGFILVLFFMLTAAIKARYQGVIEVRFGSFQFKIWGNPEGCEADNQNPSSLH